MDVSFCVAKKAASVFPKDYKIRKILEGMKFILHLISQIFWE